VCGALVEEASCKGGGCGFESYVKMHDENGWVAR
jgi:hypothetical protein